MPLMSMGKIHPLLLQKRLRHTAEISNRQHLPRIFAPFLPRPPQLLGLRETSRCPARYRGAPRTARLVGAGRSLPPSLPPGADSPGRARARQLLPCSPTPWCLVNKQEATGCSAGDVFPFRFFQARMGLRRAPVAPCGGSRESRGWCQWARCFLVRTPIAFL